jgi:hypothetical protein
MLLRRQGWLRLFGRSRSGTLPQNLPRPSSLGRDGRVVDMAACALRAAIYCDCHAKETDSCKNADNWHNRTHDKHRVVLASRLNLHRPKLFPPKQSDAVQHRPMISRMTTASAASGPAIHCLDSLGIADFTNGL